MFLGLYDKYSDKKPRKDGKCKGAFRVGMFTFILVLWAIYFVLIHCSGIGEWTLVSLLLLSTISLWLLSLPMTGSKIYEIENAISTETYKGLYNRFKGYNSWNIGKTIDSVDKKTKNAICRYQVAYTAAWGICCAILICAVINNLDFLNYLLQDTYMLILAIIALILCLPSSYLCISYIRFLFNIRKTEKELIAQQDYNQLVPSQTTWFREINFLGNWLSTWFLLTALLLFMAHAVFFSESYVKVLTIMGYAKPTPIEAVLNFLKSILYNTQDSTSAKQSVLVSNIVPILIAIFMSIILFCIVFIGVRYYLSEIHKLMVTETIRQEYVKIKGPKLKGKAATEYVNMTKTLKSDLRKYTLSDVINVLMAIISVVSCVLAIRASSG